jgi:uncharacterized protein
VIWCFFREIPHVDNQIVTVNSRFYLTNIDIWRQLLLRCSTTVLPVHIGICAKYSRDKLVLLRKMMIMTEETTNQNSNEDIQIDDISASFSSGIAAFEAKNFKQSLQFLGPLAESGDAESQHRCAIMYQNGLGVVANEAKAAEYMRSAAEQGHPVAQHGLGFMYMEGECVEKDAQEAVKWFTKAGEQGLVGSLTTLAMMYQEGNGVEQDLEKAKELYSKAGFNDMI